MKIPNAFRLSLRDLFWLILVVGMGLGWYLDHDRDHERMSEARSFLDLLDQMEGGHMPNGFVTVLRYGDKAVSIDVTPRHKKTADSPESPPAN